MIKKLFILTIIFLLGVFSIASVEAQEEIPFEEIGIGETQEISDPALKLELSVDAEQEYPSKKISVTIKITSAIDSDRVGVNWIFPSSYFLAEGGTSDVLSVRNGETTVFKKYFVPKPIFPQTGINKKIEFGARVNAFVANVNYLSATSTVGDFNNDLEVIPVDPVYQRNKIVSTVLNWAFCITLIVIVVALIIYGVRRLKAYVDSPDPEN